MGIRRCFGNPKPTRLINRILLLTTDPKTDDIVLDFFAGAPHNPHAVLEQNDEDGGGR